VIQSVQDVADWRLCLGCGACAYICPEQKVGLLNTLDQGVRPFVGNNSCSGCTLCLQVCPAYEVDHSHSNLVPGLVKEVQPYCGPVLEIWEGHASDSEVRLAGSSGGIITALSLYCLEQVKMHGTLHIGQDPDDPMRNKTQMSFSREDLLEKTGSRYAAASACDSLHLIEQAPAPCVFVGQPSEVTALVKAQRLKPELAKKVGLTISFFCAGSPSRKGTLELLKSKGIDPDQVETLRYRGNGWPGMFAVTLKGRKEPVPLMTYVESWGFVQAFRPFSTHLCPDGSGEDADISCGDPWYRPVQPGELGSSIVAVRTERGRRIIQGAIAAGYVQLQPAEPWKLIESQRNLFEKRGAIWGRIAALRLFGLPAPKLKGFYLFQNWKQLSFNSKFRSTFGTVRRILTRKYYKPIKFSATEESAGEQGMTRPPVNTAA
jgi:coenzyme F420 hydrogenase subunit beta